jgi:hypothetical protein
MSDWSLKQLFSSLNDEVEQKLNFARQSFGHQPTKGTASENVWLELLKEYLPQRYQAENAHVVDSEGTFSDQIDIVIFDHKHPTGIKKTLAGLGLNLPFSRDEN